MRNPYRYVVHLSTGDTITCKSRADARMRANYYRTMCDPPLAWVRIVDTMNNSTEG